MKRFIAFVIMLLPVATPFAQTGHNTGHDTVKYAHKHHKPRYSNRMEMQLRQARYHEQQVKRAEQAQKKAAAEQQ